MQELSDDTIIKRVYLLRERFYLDWEQWGASESQIVASIPIVGDLSRVRDLIQAIKQVLNEKNGVRASRRRCKPALYQFS
jgi:hypothetical protein